MAVIKHNSCMAAINREVDEDTGEEYLVLHNIESKCKGIGDGSIVLEECKRYANTLDLELRCHPWALNGEHERLRAWYEKHEFVDIGDWFVWNPPSYEDICPK